MTHDERVQALTQLGFTPRRASFLVLVMLHAGVCLGRQYCTHARIVRGQTVTRCVLSHHDLHLESLVGSA